MSDNAAPEMDCDAVELVALAKKGDPEALHRATRCYSQRLLAAGRKVCGNPSDAPDAVQDALLSAVRALPTFRGEGSLEGWLVRMVAHACLKITRGRKNDPRLRAAGSDFPDPGDDPEVIAGRAEIVRALEGALAMLPPAERLIVMLADVDGCKGPEIAQHLQLSHSVVRTRLSRARRALRAHLERALPES